MPRKRPPPVQQRHRRRGQGRPGIRTAERRTRLRAGAIGRDLLRAGATLLEARLRGGGMNAAPWRYVYGPVFSRRLGRSLGVDLVTFKTCTYDCIYCQLGRTTEKTADRREYVPISGVLDELKRKLAAGSDADYITLAGSGEPTLNRGIGTVIRGIKALSKIPIAVLTNGSLLWNREVQDALLPADLVIPSLDAGDERLFRRVNRPHAGIAFDAMVDGLMEFTARFPGEVWLEVFLLDGLTGVPSAVEKISCLAAKIAPARVQLATVYRPPAEKTARPVSAARMRELSALFQPAAEILASERTGRPSAPASASAVSDADILDVLRRHPCTLQDAADALHIHAAEALKRLDGLASAGKARTVAQDGKVFYLMADTDIPPET
jgi:wyosine [tRNA(Phe)-imidazoG37] synthetase (radical SAM superfamily)